MTTEIKHYFTPGLGPTNTKGIGNIKDIILTYISEQKSEYISKLEIIKYVDTLPKDTLKALEDLVLEKKLNVSPLGYNLIYYPKFIPSKTNLVSWTRPKRFDISSGVCEDESGLKNSFNQPDPTLRPIINPTGINGKPSLNCSNSKYLELLNTPLFVDSLTFHIVLKNNGVNPGYGNPLILAAAAFFSPGPFFIQINNLSNRYNINGSSAGVNNTNIAPLNTNAIIITVVKSPTTIQIKINGVEVVFRAAIQNFTGINHFLGRWAGNGWNGEIGDLLLYNADQSVVDVSTTIEYLKEEYNIT